MFFFERERILSREGEERERESEGGGREVQVSDPERCSAGELMGNIPMCIYVYFV
jgi:hypothetical protein